MGLSGELYNIHSECTILVSDFMYILLRKLKVVV